MQTVLSAALAIYVVLLGVSNAYAADAGRVEFAIAIHGGAGVEPDKLSAEQKREHQRALTRALTVGRDILAKGGSALDAVEQTIRVLEDEPLYNAGRGAVFNSVGKHELDAAIMDGRNRATGAVAGVMTVKNPISLARLVMTETRHVLLMGDGAEKFADEMHDRQQIERVPNEYFSTQHRRREWEEAVQRDREKAKPSSASGKGTVGCVAVDKQGNLAAGTSTGGLTNKKWGRIGGVPIAGAGTFADNHSCAMSGTGTGEEFIRNSVGFQLHALMTYRKLSLNDAVAEVVDKVLDDDSGGIIAIDSQGRIVMRCNTPGMARAATDSRGKVEVFLAR